MGSLLGGALAGLAGCASGSGVLERASTAKSVMGLRSRPLDVARFGVIGVGQRGSFLTKTLCQIEGARVVAIADTDAQAIDKTLGLIAKAGRPKPDVITGSSGAWQRMLDRDDIDAVLIVTPWELHTPMAVAAMRAGKHAFVEIPAAVSVDEAWQLVDTAEATQRHCMMLENCCYGREELMVLHMVRLGLFGELLHAEGAYIHDLRWQIKELTRSTGSWRTLWHARRDGNLYPTHGLGPIAQYFGINRGDRFDYINSQSSPARTFAEYSRKNFPADHPRNQLRYINGDINTSLIKCASGRTIMVQHDTNTPRPYSRLNTVVGTNGSFGGFPNRIALETLDGKTLMDASGKQEAFHHWDGNMQPWFDRYDHPLWKRLAQEAQRNGGHGGMDYVMMWRVVYSLIHGEAMDQDVYDAASWSAVFPLSCDSVADRGNAKDFPDFTRGAWKTTKPLGIVA
ncbi:Gfo/Idh/MocA family protein [Roseateles sp. BYS180W]|uniref:Gfo/Idh/MocA family protein n=1 Tax=Roseateles rivi TaxID=3299028 RepID=A0ABW7FZK6_9BURK